MSVAICVLCKIILEPRIKPIHVLQNLSDTLVSQLRDRFDAEELFAEPTSERVPILNQMILFEFVIQKNLRTGLW